MSILEWKKVELFNLLTESENQEIFNKLSYIKGSITAVCFNDSFFVFCDEFGNVHIFRSNWKKFTHFQAHEYPGILCSISSDVVLSSIEHDTAKQRIRLKIFNLSTINVKKYEKTSYAKSFANLVSSSAPTALKIIVVDNVSYIAIGLETGDILMYRGGSNLSGDITSGFRRYSVSKKSITGIEFSKGFSSTFVIFVYSNEGVFSFPLAVNDNTLIDVKNPFVSKNSGARCHCLQRNENSEPYFCLGCDDAIYCFTSDGRGPCYVMKGEKKCISWLESGHLVFVIDENQIFGRQESSYLIVLDIKNKIVVLQKEMNDVNCLITSKGNCFVLTKNNKIFSLKEESFMRKINLLLEKNLFDIAMKSITSTSMTNTEIAAEVHLKYADYLLSKNDTNGAARNYVKTIKYMQPYMIIKKLMDARYHAVLIEYLNALIQATPDNKKYISMLKTSTDKLQIPERIRAVASKTVQNDFSDCGMMSLDTNEFLQKDPERFYAFVKKMDEDELYSFFAEYKDLLAKHMPLETVKILKRLVNDGHVENGERFLPFIDGTDALRTEFLEHLLSKAEDPKKYVNMLISIYIKEWADGRKSTEEILAFFTKYKNVLDHEQVFLASKKHNFYAGIRFLCECDAKSHISFWHLIRDMKTPMALEDLSYLSDSRISLWLKSFARDEMISNISPYVVNKLMFNAYHNRGLHNLKHICRNDKLTAVHVRDLFKEKTFCKNQKEKQIDAASEQLNTLRNALKAFCCNPIEVRSSFCDICKQTLNVPAVFYFCKHSFHKECINSYSHNNICVTCSNNFVDNEKIVRDTSENVTSNNPIEYIAQNFQKGLMQRVNERSSEVLKIPNSITDRTIMPEEREWRGRLDTKSYNSEQSMRNPQQPTATRGKNPFEDYDTNFNPI